MPFNTRPPAGYVDINRAIQITGYHIDTIRTAARAGQIPGAIQRIRKAPWYFTEAGLRRWIGIADDEDGAA